jgi:hypothetical protein
VQSPTHYLKNASFRQGRRVAERWTQECLLRGDLAIEQPILYQAYVCDGGPAFERTRCRTVSDYFQSDLASDPALAATRESLVRLMAIVAKAHFFLFRADLMQEEPVVFWVPDLMRSNKDRFGIYCPFLKSQKALVVAQADLALVSSGKLALGRFPVALTPEHESWFDERHWESLAREGDAQRLIQESLPVSEGRAAREHRDEASFPFGRVFEIPDDLRPHMKAAGLRWAEGIGKMYLPKGFDYAPVRAYCDQLLAEWNASVELRSQLGAD